MGIRNFVNFAHYLIFNIFLYLLPTSFHKDWGRGRAQRYACELPSSPRGVCEAGPAPRSRRGSAFFPQPPV